METEERKMDDTLEMINTELQRCKNNEQELYSLDRERAATMSDIQQKVTKIQTEQETMKGDLQEFKKDMTSVKTKVETVEKKVDKVETKVDQVQSEVSQIKKITQDAADRKQWTPKDYCVIIVAILSLIGTFITAILK